MDFDNLQGFGNRSNLNSSFDTEPKYPNDQYDSYNNERSRIMNLNEESLLDSPLGMRDPFSSIRGDKMANRVHNSDNTLRNQHQNNFKGGVLNQDDEILNRVSLEFGNEHHEEHHITGFLRGTEYDIFGQAEVSNHCFIS